MEEIFSIQLDERGMQYLKKIRKLVPYLFWASVIISVTALVLLWPSIKILLGGSVTSYVYRVEGYAGFIYTIVFALVFPFQTYYYYSFIRKTGNSYETGDGEAFNEGFRLLFLNALMMVITYTFNLLFFLAEVYFVLIR